MRRHEKFGKHADWVAEFLTAYTEVNADNVEHILEQEVGKVFCQVLEDAGVYKCTEDGMEKFRRFIAAL